MCMLTKEERKELIDKYPFLYPRHSIPNQFGEKWKPYNYEWFDLDHLPDGWIKSWIPNFLSDVKAILIYKKYNLDDYFVVRMKHELWNKFIWIANINISEINRLVEDYNKYLDNYCIFCGSKPVYKSTWGFYACRDCAKKDFDETQAMYDIFDDKIKWEDEYQNIYSY